MSILFLSLLGSFQARVGEGELAKFRTAKVQALLIYLAVEADAAHRREAVMELLWPGLPLKSAQVNLRQVLYQLRRAIPQVTAKGDDAPVPLVLSDRQMVQINPDADVQLDVTRFSGLLAGVPTAADMTDAIALYRGDFLSDFYLPDSAEFEDWATHKRAELRRQALDALDALIDHHNERGEYDQAQAHAWRALELDALRESAHRGLMRALALDGQREAALTQFRVLRERLNVELGIEPSAETAALAEKIKTGGPLLPESPVSTERPALEGLRGYELRERIGAGGFGEVYRAYQPSVSRAVAIKVILSQYANHPEFVRRFEAEAQLVARLEHPHIVPLYDYWRDPSGSGAYLVMRWLEGGNLYEALQRGPWEPEAAARLLDQIAEALAVAHREGIVHRDVKPENILLDRDGNAYLTDFGIAKDVLHATGLTAPDALPGSLWYISPEQARGGPVTPQSDIYSLGLVLYQVLTGQHPFSSLGPGEQLARRLSELLPPLAERRPDLPDGLDEVLQQATARVPVERYPDSTSFARAFREVLARPVIEASGAAPPPALIHRLPVQPTPFVGRGPELAQLNGLLAGPEVRLVTVLGAGGMGKTRLALEAAAAQLRRYLDGVFFVSLAGVESPAGILPAVAQALGFSFYPEREPSSPGADLRSPAPAPRQQLLDYLRGKRTLLLLDNFEHLLPTPDTPAAETEQPTGLVSDILRTAPEVDILTTSRTALSIEGEQLFHLGGMRYPPGEDIRLDGLDDAAGFSALQLFASSAQRAGPDFQLTSQNLKDVVRICRLVEGAPLAIILAAAWVTTLNLAEIADEIERDIDLLETGLRDVPPRQRSMRATFEHSWRLLSARGQEVLAGLSVFRGGFDREAAQALTGASLLELRGLVERSLVNHDETPVAGQGLAGRYRLHELLRQCAAEKLAELPDVYGAARERHCAYFVDALQGWGDELKGPRQRTALEEMDLEIDNARAAWNWAVAQRQVQRLNQAIEGLYMFYSRRLRWEEGEMAFRAAADKLRTDATGDALRVLAALMARRAVFCLSLGKSEQASQLLGESLTLLGALEPLDRDTRRERAYVLLHMGNHALDFESGLETARQLFDQSLMDYSELGDQYGTAIVLERLSWLAVILGEYTKAETSFRESLTIRRALDDPGGIASALVGLGTLLAGVLGRCEEGEEAMREGIAIYQEQGDRAGVAYGLGQLSAALLPQGKYDDTCTALAEAAAIYTDLAFPMANDWWNLWIGFAEMYLGRYERARSLGEAALAASRELALPVTVARALHLMGCLALVEAAYAEAHAYLSESVSIYRSHVLPNELVWALPDLAIAERGMGQAPQALQHLHTGLQTGTEFGTAPQLVLALPAAALFLLDRGAVERAVEVYALAARYGCIANARWYEDVFGRHVAAAAATLPPDVVAAAQARGRERDLLEAAEELLQELQRPSSPPKAPNNLPPQQTPFIGREGELADLDRLIADPDVRQVTIVGPGGIGKTRLALAAAERQLTQSRSARPASGQTLRFPHGVFFVSLAALDSVEQILPAVAEALGLRLGGGDGGASHLDPRAIESRTSEQQVFDYLREKRLLLVLDNLEHLLTALSSGSPEQGGLESGASALVADILRVAPETQILATSRERLLLHEEQVFPIKGLEFPDWERPEDTAEYTAAQLFQQSARRVRPGFELGADDLTYLARICRLLEGLPLAIELAAAWVDALSLADIAAEVARDLDFLETEWRDVPVRHRSMRAVFDGSWRHLSQAEKDALQQLSVFRGGFTRQAARDIVGASLRTLAALVSKSLLYYNQARDRYEVHELLRQYGAEKLGADGEGESAVRDRHSTHYLSALQKLDEDFAAARALPLEIIDADVENIRVAWEWAVAQRDIAGLDRARWGLGLYRLMRSRFQDGLALCRRAADMLRRQGHALSPETSRLLARVLALQALFSAGLLKYTEARSLAQASHELLGDPALAGLDTRADRAFVLWIEGACAWPDDAGQRRLFEQSLALFRALGHSGGITLALRRLAWLHTFTGEVDQAKRMYEECLALYEGGGDQRAVAGALADLGYLARFRYDYEESRRLYEKSLQLSQAHGLGEATAITLTHLGWLALLQGQFEAAVVYLAEGADISREIGNWSWLYQQLSNIAAGLWLSGQFDQARQRIAEADSIAQAMESPVAGWFVATFAAKLDLYTGQYGAARAHAQRALGADLEVHDPFILGRAYGVIGWSELAEGRYGEAVQSLEDSVAAFRAYNDQEYVAWSLTALGLALCRLGEREQAHLRLLEALQITVTMRAFIPLLHLMPVFSRALAETDDSRLVERGLELYALAESHPFVARAQLFSGIAGQHIDEIAENRDAETVEATRRRGRALDWWQAAEALLAELRALG
jgi:predicted ATPase/DNA-binding SARP family transcriptional activator